MIGPVNGYSGNSYSVPPTDNKTGTGSDQPFSLTRDDGGVYYEPGGRKKEESSVGRQSKDSSESPFAKSGVSLELSDAGRDRAQRGEESQASIFDKITELFQKVAGVFSKAGSWLVGFWNGEENTAKDLGSAEDAIASEGQNDEDIANAAGIRGTASDLNSESATAGMTSGAMEDSAVTDEEARRLLHPPNDPEAIQKFMTGYDGRTLAKNSDLLTYYDKHGRRVEVDASDRRQILQGKRGELKS